MNLRPPLDVPGRPRSGARGVVRVLLAAFLIADLYLPAWADYRFSRDSAEEELGLVAPPPSGASLPEQGTPVHFDPQRWNRAREAIERGEEPGLTTPAAPSGVEVSTGPVTPEPEQLGLNVELPYESGLSISGRKLIALKLKETRRKSARRASELNVKKLQRDFEMRQELQVRIKGKVGRKITVNVDFDDTKEDKRDISVMYQGDPEEFVQEAAFGDITLSLPSTEFVSYSKQLFGVRTRLKYKRAQFMAIGSRTKGITETKRFTGNSQFERKEISDTAFVSRRYYLLAFNASHLPLVIGSEEIWLDNRIATDNGANTRTFAVEDFAVAASSYTGAFNLLRPGQDYTVDYARGIVNFRNPLAQNAVVAVDYRLGSTGQKLSELGTPGRLKLLKTENDLPVNPAQAGTELGYRRELKTFYTIGRNKILRDNGRGNFILNTMDLNRNPVDIPLDNGPTLRYPDNLEVDFEAGTFNIAPPFKVADGTLYAPTPAHKFTFFLEYRYRLKTYIVKPNLVFESERILVDGRLLTRDIDYFIDYDSGFLTFTNEEQIDENTEIEVTYEFAPFGGQLGQTLVGARTELSLVPDKVFAGTTVLYTFAPRPSVLPDIRAAPGSLMVLEADGRVENVKVPFVPLTLSLAGEAAQSRENPNLFGKALVDSMEGIKQEEQTIMDQRFWLYGANPTGGGVTRPSALAVADEELKLSALNPQAQTREGDTQRVLTLKYALANKPGFATLAEQASLVQPMSSAGRDFSKKIFMEVWIEGAGEAGKGMDLLVDAGQFNEDADGDGELDTEDFNNDGTLNTGEDVGIRYDDPGPDGIPRTADDALVRIGAGNGRVDTEDLDADGSRDFSDQAVRAFPLFKLSNAPTTPGLTMTDPATGLNSPSNDLGFTGWRFVQIPLDIGASEEPSFQAVKQVRLTLVGDPTGAARAGQVRVGKVAFVGNRWERAETVNGSSMTVTSINNIDNPNYRSLLGHPAYEDLYEETSGRLREQALDLLFDLPAGSTASTKVTFPTARDFARHKSFRFFVQAPAGKAVGETLFVQLGSNSDYFEYVVPITAQYSDAWVMEGASLLDLNDDGTPDVMEPLQATAKVTVVGKPSLTSVGQIRIGVRNETGSPISSELWVNEIHLSGARLKVGDARRFKADLTWANWGTAGGSFRAVDRNFQTLTSPITNQDKTEESGYLTFTRLRLLPLSFSGSRALTVTPAAVRTGESGLVSVLEEGRVKSFDGSGKGELALPYLPRFGFGYDKSVTDSNLLRRLDDKDTYTGSLNYSLPWRLDLVPGRYFALRPLPDSVSVTYHRTVYFLSFYPEKKREELALSTSTLSQKTAIFTNVRTVEYSDDWSGRTGFSPWTGLTVSPNYSWKRVREQRRFSEPDLALAPEFTPAKDYDKSLAQSHGLTASWRLLRWLEPRASYSHGGTETNVLPTVSTPTAFNFKSLDRTGDGEASWTFNARELLPNFKPVQSFNVNNSFRIQDGDTYDNVSRAFKEWQKIRPIRVQRVERENGGPVYTLLPELELNTSTTSLVTGGVRRKQLTVRNTFRTSGNWSPLDWIRFPRMLEPLKTFGLTATVTKTDEHTETTETLRDSLTVIWPDYIFSMRDTEKLYGLRRWMSNSQANVRTNRKRTETFKTQFTQDKSFGTDYRFTLFKRYDFFSSYARTNNLDLDLRTNLLNRTGKGYSVSSQVGMTFGPWRFTPSAGFKTDFAEDGEKKTLTDLATHDYGLRTRFDKAYPEGFRFPFTKKVFGKVNRFILDHNVSYSRTRSSLNVERDNTDTITTSLTGEYEISQNFRWSLGAAGSLIKNRVKKDDGVMTYELNSSLTIQF